MVNHVIVYTESMAEANEQNPHTTSRGDFHVWEKINLKPVCVYAKQF